MRHSKRSLEGEILIDHRASPGLPAEFAVEMGVDPALLAAGQVLEAPIFNCSHCQCAVIINPDRSRERAVCLKCGGKYICDECAAVMHLTLECRNRERRFDQVREDVEHGVPLSLLTTL